MAASPTPPRWFGPRAGADDPAVAALLHGVAPGVPWCDIGGEFNLNLRLDAAVPVVLRVHRPWATRARVVGLRRLRERLRAAGLQVARPVPILGRDVARVAHRWAELEEFVPHLSPRPSQATYVRLFEELGRLHGGLRATWAPDVPEPLDDHRTLRQLHYWLGFTRRRLGEPAESVVRRAKRLLEELGTVWRDAVLPSAPIHGDYKIGNVGLLPDGSWLTLDLDFVRVRERLYDVAVSLYWASESGAHLDLRALCDAYDATAPDPLTLDERRCLPAQLTLIPLHWVATAGLVGGMPEAERAMHAAEAWWARRDDVT